MSASANSPEIKEGMKKQALSGALSLINWAKILLFPSRVLDGTKLRIETLEMGEPLTDKGSNAPDGSTSAA